MGGVRVNSDLVIFTFLFVSYTVPSFLFNYFYGGLTLITRMFQPLINSLVGGAPSKTTIIRDLVFGPKIVHMKPSKNEYIRVSPNFAFSIARGILAISSITMIETTWSFICHRYRQKYSEMTTEIQIEKYNLTKKSIFCRIIPKKWGKSVILIAISNKTVRILSKGQIDAISVKKSRHGVYFRRGIWGNRTMFMTYLEKFMTLQTGYMIQ